MRAARARVPRRTSGRAPTDEVARLAGIDESQVLRFDQNTPPLPLPSTRPGAIAGALARVSGYPAAATARCARAIADYAGVEPENVVLGAGADDLILLCARAFAGPGDTIAIPPAPDLSALPDRRAARRRTTGRAATDAGPDVRLPPEQPDRRARRRCPTRGRSSSTRRTSSTAARPRSTLLDEGVDRAAHVLEALRARRRARRLRARARATSPTS